jgi:hypothetical protein
VSTHQPVWCCWLAAALGRRNLQSLQGGPLPEARARALFQQLITAVDYSHRLGVSSRDIKLDNMLLWWAVLGFRVYGLLTLTLGISMSDTA